MSETGRQTPNVSRGILLKVTALFLFTIMASLVKAAQPAVPPYEAVFFRSFFAMLVIIVWLILRKELRTGLKVKNPMAHFWRGVIGTTSMGLGFAGLGLLPLPEVTAIGFTAPMLVVVFAAILLGERIRLFRISAVVIGLIGVGVVVYPRLTFLSGDTVETMLVLGVALTLGSAVFRALAHIHIRKLAQAEQTSAIVFYFSLTATVLSWLTLPLGWVVPGPTELTYLICAGLVGGLAQICLTSSYKYSEASLLAPFDYVSMLYAIAFGYFLFAEIPTLNTLAGSVLIVIGGIIIIWRERQLGLKRGKARPNMTPQG